MKSNREDSIWVRSQNKEELVNCISFSIRKNYGGKKKAVITGTMAKGFLGRKEILLGMYDTRESAVNELNQLQTALVNATEVYEMN